LTDLSENKYPHNQDAKNAGHEKEQIRRDVTGSISQTIQHISELGHEMVFSRDFSIEKVATHDYHDKSQSCPKAYWRMRFVHRQYSE
jgi:hypothetical protein